MDESLPLAQIFEVGTLPLAQIFGIQKSFEFFNVLYIREINKNQNFYINYNNINERLCKKKKNNTVWIVSGIIIVYLLVVGAFWVGRASAKNTPDQPKDSPQPRRPNSPPYKPNPPSNPNEL